jgi:hydroxyacylglutathione hydrolase
MGLQITPIPCLQDNYAYLLVCERTGRTAVVDPSESEPILNALSSRRLELHAILNTHHHWDHTGGNEALLERFPGIPVYGHRSDAGRIPGQTVQLEAGDVLELGETRATVLHIPGHTLGAVAYAFDGAVFTGDTLFGAGCGRLFEGTPEMMYRALNITLAGLPPDTLVYCGHEYTKKNIEFALTLEPHNLALHQRRELVDALRSNGAFTVPSTLAEERATNPFMRCDSPELLQTLETVHHLELRDPVDVLAAVRRLKDRF